MTEHSGYAEVNGTQLYYEMAGSGDALVMIHGAVLDRRMWTDQWLLYAESYQVIRYDLRGHGKSALPTDERFFNNQDLKALLDHLGIGKAHLVGLSAGGNIAVNFALDYPEATQSLILVDSVLDGYQNKYAEDWQEIGDIVSQIVTSGLEGHKHLLLNTTIFAPSMERSGVSVLLKQIIGDYSGWHWLNKTAISTSHENPAINRLDEIKAPTLIIVGERDLRDLHTQADIMAEEINGAQKVVIADVGHMSNMEDPKKFNEIVLRFLDSIS